MRVWGYGAAEASGVPVKNRWLIGGGYFLTSRNGLVVAPRPRFSFVTFGIDLYQIKGRQKEPVSAESLYVTLYVAAYRPRRSQERENPKIPRRLRKCLLLWGSSHSL